MPCIHNDYHTSEEFGGCSQCGEEYRTLLIELESNPSYVPKKKPFIYNPLHYHMELEGVEVLHTDKRFTNVIFDGKIVNLPNKIIRYSEGKMYAHKRILHNILCG